jgi:TatD DNase family protein
MIIDTHAHLNFNAFKDDSDEIIRNCLDNDLWVINVGTQKDTSKKAIELAEKYEKGVFAAIGLHPIHLDTGLVKLKIDEEEANFTSREEVFDYEDYKKMARSEKVVAIGEIGLDYWRKPKTEKKIGEFKKRQKQAFLEQRKLAKELVLPMIIHCRLAHDDILELIDSKDRGVVHCFTGNITQAKEYLAKGFYLGFNGIIFKLNLRKIIRKTPLERILVETDSPYLTPPAEEGRNNPFYVKHVINEIAKIKEKDPKEIENITSENAKRLFNI